MACWPEALIAEMNGSIFVQLGVEVANTSGICAASRASVTPAFVSRLLSPAVRKDSPRPYPNIFAGTAGVLLARDPKSAVMDENTVTWPAVLLLRSVSVRRIWCLPAVRGAV